MKKVMLFSLLYVCCVITYAKGTVYSAATEAPLDEVYTSVYAALEENRFFVVFEANMGRTLSRFAEDWGEDYNRNKLKGIRSMVVCNAWYTNQVSNKDPSMLSLCPLTVTLIHKEGVTTVLFARPSVIAQGSPAQSILMEVEQDLIAAINEGLK